jgi:EAL domain-containing protein (putative c-di-GMP-specific phosphodiesterase class I)
VRRALAAGGAATFEVELVTGRTTVSENFGGLFALVPRAFSGQYDDFLQVVHPDDRSRIDLQALRSLAAGTLLEADFRTVLPTGEERQFHQRCRTAVSAGRPTTVLGVMIEGRSGRPSHVDRPPTAMTGFDAHRELREALERDELRVWFQPVVSASTGRTPQVEALLRWEHPTRGLLAPLEFLPVAADNGLSLLLEALVLRGACHQLARWRAGLEQLSGLSVAVSLSGPQLLDPSLPGRVAHVLAESALEPEALCLGCTESTLMDDRAEEGVQRLHALGVRVAVDDFGAGYSSLLYLRRFSLQRVRLHRAFVGGLGREPADTSIVKATIDLAHALGLDVVATGVDNAEQLGALHDVGCDLVQGSFVAPPLPAVEATAYLHS